MYPIVFRALIEDANGTAATFYCKETRELITAVPSDKDNLSLFCKVLNGKQTAMLKDGGVISLQFPMNCIADFQKGDDSEVETVKPAPGSEKLFRASFKVRGTWNGQQIRQIEFPCHISAQKDANTFPLFVYGESPLNVYDISPDVSDR